jgi:hypothetical protein
VAAELGKRLAQPVECVGVSAQLQDLLVGGDRRLPFAARGLPDGDIGEVPSLAVDRLRLVERHRLPMLNRGGKCRGKCPFGEASRPKGALL